MLLEDHFWDLLELLVDGLEVVSLEEYRGLPVLSQLLVFMTHGTIVLIKLYLITNNKLIINLVV